ncbi:MAG: hypothetical protein Q4E60_11390, partial [Bacteroidales bacterium]|nr:hypothetical protein [Bacteroidales bacterium]
PLKGGRKVNKSTSQRVNKLIWPYGNSVKKIKVYEEKERGLFERSDLRSSCLTGGTLRKLKDVR